VKGVEERFLVVKGSGDEIGTDTLLDQGEGVEIEFAGFRLAGTPIARPEALPTKETRFARRGRSNSSASQ